MKHSLLKQLRSFFTMTDSSNSNHSFTSLASMHLKIRLIMWFFTFLYVLIAPLLSKYRFPLLEFYAICIPGWLLYFLLIFKCKNDFVVGLPSLITALIVIDNTLSKSDYYLRMLASSVGIITVYSVQGFPFQLILVFGVGYMWLQHQYMFQLTKMYEPMTNAYHVPEPIIDDFVKGWSRTLLLTVICTMLYQAIIQRIWNFSQKIQQNLEDTNKKLQQANEKLEKTVQELATSNAQLKQALESQDLFVACVSHELRNPLNVMLGSLDLLESQVKDKTHREILETCKICGDALLNQINNLLDVAKINSEKLEISEFSTKMSVFLDRFWAYTRIGLDKKSLIGHLQVDRNLPGWLTIDSHRLQQILNNLIGNAIKFTSEGSVRVSIYWNRNRYSSDLNASPTSRQNYSSIILKSLESSEVPEEDNSNHMDLSSFVRNYNSMRVLENMISFNSHESVKSKLETLLTARSVEQGDFLKIDIMDTGCGITEEAQRIIFQPFIQGDRSVTRKYGGTGLGLYIVKNLVEKMGGSITMNSRKDHGTLFQVILPVRSISGPIEMMNSLPRTSNTVEAFRLDTIKDLGPIRRRSKKSSTVSQKNIVLIVDDDAFNQSIMTQYFQSLGFDCDVASNGMDGFLKYQKDPEKYNLITMDIQMPVMDGITACKKIRRYEKEAGRRNVNIVVVTGNCSENEQKECLEQGEIQADFFFRKPFRLSDCKLCVQKITSGIIKRRDE